MPTDIPSEWPPEFGWADTIDDPDNWPDEDEPDTWEEDDDPERGCDPS